MAIINYPTYLQPGASDIVGFNLTLTDKGPQPSRYVSFGQAFVAGKVPTTAALTAKLGTSVVAAQMDWKTKHPDGTVRFAVITVPVPAMAANAVLSGMLSLATGAPADHLPVLTALKTYDVVVTLSGGVAASINVGAKLMAAIRAKTSSYWLRGEHAVQARVDVPIKDALHLVADVTAFADGTFLSDLQFRNDHAMQSYGGTLNYNVNISQVGTTVFGAAIANHFQYESWRRVFHTNGAPTDDTHNVQHDIAYLVKAGALQNYDLTTGIDDTSIDSFASTNIAPLSNPGWYKAMPSGGGRDDIGPMPAWYARWVKCQGWKAARAAIAMGNGAGSIPWHHFDPTTNDYLSIVKYPKLWIDDSGRGGPFPGSLPPNQPVRDDSWYLDNAHAPDVAFVPYLLTGQRYFLDELNAQTSRQVCALWPQPRDETPYGQGVAMVGTDAYEVRAQVWTFRNIIEAAWANPDNSPTKAYWLKILDANCNNLLENVIPFWTARAGETAGYIYGIYGTTLTTCWQQDYAVSVVALAVSLRPANNAKPLKIMKWMQGFDLGRFTHQAQGFGWAAAVSYNLTIKVGNGWLDTWTELGAANEQGNGLPQDGSNFVALGLETLATLYNTTGNAQAKASYLSLKAADAPGTRTVDYQTRYPQFHIVPAA